MKLNSAKKVLAIFLSVFMMAAMIVPAYAETMYDIGPVVPDGTGANVIGTVAYTNAGRSYTCTLEYGRGHVPNYSDLSDTETITVTEASVGEVAHFEACGMKYVEQCTCGYVIGVYYPTNVCASRIKATNTDVIGNAKFTLEKQNGFPYVMLNFECMNPGDVTVKYTLYQYYGIPSRTGYCGGCGAYITCPAVNFVQRDIIIDITVDETPETECQHPSISYVPAENGTHNIFCNVCKQVIGNEAHVDANGDNFCDLCRAYMGSGSGTGDDEHTHVDANDDGVCDDCGEVIGGGSTLNPDHEHVDADHDDKCDICGKDMNPGGNTGDDNNNDHEHKDDNGDGVCDDCNKPIDTSNCPCWCHREGKFWKVVYKFMFTLWKLFGTHKYCQCGIRHYGF